MVNLSSSCSKMFRKVLKRLKSFGQKTTCLDNSSGSSSQSANSCSYLAVTQPDVFIESIYEDNQHNQQHAKQIARRKRIGDQMAADLEEVFTHYFGDVPAFVWNTCKEGGNTPVGPQKAYKRLRELQHTKHFLARMIHFYEAQQSDNIQEDGLENFMDTYFSSLYDLVLACIMTIELAHPELEVIGKRPSFLHTSSATQLSKRRSLPVCREEDEDVELGEEVVEKYRLVACAIEKNMSTVLTAIMCYLFNQTAFKQANRSLTNDPYNTRFCKGQNEHQFIPTILQVYNTTRLYDWTLLAIVRDPIERFLSGFVDKCIKHCNFPFCLSQYHLLHYKNGGEQVIQRMLEIFEQVGVPPASIEVLRDELVIEQSKYTQHTTRAQLERRLLAKQIEEDVSLRRRLLQMFYFDYVLFGFDMPEI